MLLVPHKYEESVFLFQQYWQRERSQQAMMGDFWDRCTWDEPHRWKTLGNASNCLAQLQTGEQRPDAIVSTVAKSQMLAGVPTGTLEFSGSSNRAGSRFAAP